MPHSTRCSGCKYFRRRCSSDCIFAPYFPSSDDPNKFARIHKIYGANNVSSILKQIPVHLRADAVECMDFEATWRIQDPVYGCLGIISRLQDQIVQAEYELAKIQGQLVYHSFMVSQPIQENKVENYEGF